MKALARLLLVLIVLFVAPALHASVKPRVFTLDNGLNVLIKPMRGMPVVAVNFWIKVGSVNEEQGQEGYVHLIERVMFKGTPRYPHGNLDAEIKKMGITQNTFTANDYTCFYLVGASEYFEKMLEFQSDAVLNSLFDDEELQKELPVVIEELRMTLDNPPSRALNLLMSEAFKEHSYRHPIAGYLESLENVTREGLYDFYRQYYVPSNMWVIIVGDIEVNPALDIVRKYLGNAPKEPQPVHRVVVEPEQTGMRNLVEYGDIQHSYIRLGWHVPGIESEDRFALYVIAQLVGGGKSSWLWKELVDQESLALSAGSGYYSSQFPMLFQVAGVTSPGKSRLFVQRARQIVYRLTSGTISSEEIDRARQQIIASDIFGRETAEDQANNYGHYAMLATVTDADTFVDQIRNVTVEQIQRVASKYFRDNNLTIAKYEPAPPDPDSPPQMMTLDNGIRLIVKQNHSSPIVAVSMKIAAGGLQEGSREAGLANLVAEMLDKGADGMSHEEINEAFENLGSEFSVSASKSFVTVELKSLAENFWPSLELMLRVLEKPEFPESEIDKMKAQIENRILAEEDDLYEYTANASLDALFPGTPVGYSSYGKISEIAKLRRNDLREFHKKYYTGANMVAAVVGDIHANEFKEYLLIAFAKLPQGKAQELKEYGLKDFDEPVIVELKKNREQAQIVFAARTFPAASELVPPMAVAQNILSGSMSSRLFKNLRNEASLAYSTWAEIVGLPNAGYFVATINTSPARAEEAKEKLKRELDLFREEGFSEQEFEDARKYMIGQYALSLADNLSMANTFASDELLGKGFDYYLEYPDLIASVTAKQVTKVTNEYLLASNSYVIGITTP